jgi:hypothetical protein
MPSSYETTQDIDLTDGDDNFNNIPKFNRVAFTNGSPQEELLSNYTQAQEYYFNRKDKQSNFNMSLKVEEEQKVIVNNLDSIIQEAH